MQIKTFDFLPLTFSLLITTIHLFADIPLVKTGVTEIVYSGDDGTYQRGVDRSYTRNNNLEVVVDNTTGLIWEDGSHVSGNNKLTWQEAIDYCNSLNLGEYDDWYLPNYDELKSIVDYSKYDPSIDNTFKNTENSWYWASTSYAGSNTNAWVVVFDSGVSRGQFYRKNSTCYVRCVRGGEICNFDNLNISTSIELNENSNIADTFQADGLTTIVSSEPTNGNLILENNSFIYTPNSDFFGNDEFSLNFTDGNCEVKKAIKVTVNEVLNQPPKLTLSASKTEIYPNEEITFTMLASDEDGSITSKAWDFKDGSTSSEIMAKHSFAKKGTYLVEAKVSDDLEATTTKTVSIKVLNTKPIAKDLSFEVGSEAKVITFSATDKDSDKLTYEIVTKPTKGNLSDVIDNQIIFTPNGSSGSDSFTYRVSDGEEYSNIATVTLSITQEVTPTPTPEPTTTSDTTTICQIEKNSVKIMPLDGCEFKDKYEIGKSTNFKFIYKNSTGKEFEQDIASSCEIDKSDVVLFNKFKSELTFQIDGVATLKCKYNDLEDIVTFKVGDGGKVGNRNLASIIIAGGGTNGGNSLWSSTEYLTNEIYKMFKKRDYSDEDIYYINPKPYQDLDKDEEPDDIVDAPVKIKELSKYVDTQIKISEDDIQKAFETIANRGKLDEPLYLFYVGHGGEREKGFKINYTDYFNIKELEKLISEYQDKTNNSVVIVIDSCYSGSYIPFLEKENRLIITSTDSKVEYIDENGRVSFSRFFIEKLRRGSNLETSFEYAKGKIMQIEKNQEPQLTNNRLARTFQIKGHDISGVSASGEIAIEDFISLNNPTDKILSAKVTIDSGKIKRVWASIVPPNAKMEFNAENIPYIKSDEVNLTNSGDSYYGTYDFQYNGEYKVTILAESENGDLDLTDTKSIEIEDKNDFKLVEVKKGWNLLALPTKQNIDSDKFSEYESIWIYEDKWIENPLALKYSNGFWLNSNIEKAYQFEGEDYNPSIVNLSSNWNLLGTGKDIEIEKLSDFSKVWVYRDSKWSGKKTVKVIKSGEGFWVKR